AARRAKCRAKAEGEHRDGANRRGEPEYHWLGVKFDEARRVADAGRQLLNENRRAPRGEHDPDQRTDRGEERALGEQLADDARARRAERQANRQLAFARRPASEEQVADVGASDEQKEKRGANGGPEHEPVVVAEVVLAERNTASGVDEHE